MSKKLIDTDDVFSKMDEMLEDQPAPDASKKGMTVMDKQQIDAARRLADIGEKYDELSDGTEIKGELIRCVRIFADALEQMLAEEEKLKEFLFGMAEEEMSHERRMEWLRHAFEHFDRVLRECDRRGDRLVAAELEQARAVWTPVAEALPEIGQAVLTAGDGYQVAVFRPYDSLDGDWWSDSIGYFDNVAHWMPLPEPPAEDRKLVYVKIDTWETRELANRLLAETNQVDQLAAALEQAQAELEEARRLERKRREGVEFTLRDDWKTAQAEMHESGNSGWLSTVGVAIRNLRHRADDTAEERDNEQRWAKQYHDQWVAAEARERKALGSLEEAAQRGMTHEWTCVSLHGTGQACDCGYEQTVERIAATIDELRAALRPEAGGE